MRKINEIFYSLQGEGAHTGCPSVFVRFSGCNLKCPFCDTSHQEGKLLSDEEIASEINRYPARWIILTGGEPSLHIDAEFISYLKTATGKDIAIETNGTRVLPDGIDWITVSPKQGISGEEEQSTVMIECANEIKVVDVGQNLDAYFHLSCRGEETLMYLQPCWVKDKKERESNLQRTIRRVLEDPRWSLSVQTHRMLEIP